MLFITKNVTFGKAEVGLIFVELKTLIWRRKSTCVMLNFRP